MTLLSLISCALASGSAFAFDGPGVDECHPFGDTGPYFVACAAAQSGRNNAGNLSDSDKKTAADAEAKAKQAGNLSDIMTKDRAQAQSSLAGAAGDPAAQAALAAKPYSPAGVSADVAKYVAQSVKTVGDLGGSRGAKFLADLNKQQADLQDAAQQYSDNAAKTQQVASLLNKQASSALQRGVDMASVKNSRALSPDASPRVDKGAGLGSAGDNAQAGAGSRNLVKSAVIGGASSNPSSALSGKSADALNGKKGGALTAGDKKTLEKLKEPGSSGGRDWEPSPLELLDPKVGMANAKPLDILAAGGYVVHGGADVTPDQEIGHLEEMLGGGQSGGAAANREPASTRTIFEIVSRQYKKRFPMFDGRLVSSTPDS